MAWTFIESVGICGRGVNTLTWTTTSVQAGDLLAIHIMSDFGMAWNDADDTWTRIWADNDREDGFGVSHILFKVASADDETNQSFTFETDSGNNDDECGGTIGVWRSDTVDSSLLGVQDTARKSDPNNTDAQQEFPSVTTTTADVLLTVFGESGCTTSTPSERRVTPPASMTERWDYEPISSCDADPDDVWELYGHWCADEHITEVGATGTRTFENLNEDCMRGYTVAFGEVSALIPCEATIIN